MSDEPKSRSPLDLLLDWSIEDSFETFKNEMAQAMLFPEKRQIRKYCLNHAVKTRGTEGLFTEFGVWRGHGVNLFAKLLPDVPIWGFDSFEGLEEDWTGHSRGGQAGRFTLKGALPDVAANVQLVKGWVQDTVPGWLDAQAGQQVIFAHLDLDTYTPTRFVLGALRDRIGPGTVLLFDELYGYPGWRHHEWKALQEALPEGNYRYLAFSEQAVGIEITAYT